MRAASLLLLASLLALTACAPAPDDRLVIFAASSLADVLGTLAPDAQINAAGSDTLATQIREGAQADIFASAAPAPAEALRAAGLVGPPRVFASNSLVLIVPRANPAAITGLADLRRAGVRIVVGAPGVPIGDYTRAVLQELNALDVLAQAVSEEQNVAAVGGKVALGEADAAFVYATDVGALGDRVREIDLPPVRVTVQAVIAVVARTTRRAAAEAFVARVLGDEGRRALADAGFSTT